MPKLMRFEPPAQAYMEECSNGDYVLYDDAIALAAAARADLESKLQAKALEYVSLFDQCSEAEKHAAEVSSLNFDLESKCALLAASLDQADKRIEAYEAGLTDGVDDEKAAMTARVEELEAKLAARESAEPIYQIQMLDDAWGDVTEDQYEHLDVESKRIVYAHPPVAAASEEDLSVLREIAALKRHDPNRDRGASHGKRIVISAPSDLFARLDAAIASQKEKKE